MRMIKWVCLACKYRGLLTTFYKKYEIEDDELWDYECPECHTTDNAHLQIPRIDLRDKKTGALKRKFYIPTPKQVMMHVSTVRNLLWGGRAGTGKSWALRHDAYMRCLTIPGYRVLILRRQYTELRDTHLDKAAIEVPQLTGSAANWRASENTALFPHPNGQVSRIRFGHCQTDDDAKQYLSSEFDLIIYDEGSTFSEYAVRFINSRLRTAKKGVVPFVRIGSNPGATWLYRYYIAKDIEKDEDPSYRPDDYQYIPATIEDNHHINLAEQEMRLNALPSEALRKMYRDGDWNAVEGQFFSEFHARKYHPDTEEIIPWHVIDELPYIDGVPLDEVPWIRYVAVLDWGYDPDPGALILYALLPSKRFIAVKELTLKKLVGPRAAKACKKFCEGLKVTRRIGGHDMWMTDRQVGESLAETFAKAGFSMHQADTDRINGWARVHTLLTETVFEGDGEKPLIQIYRKGCPNLARTLPMLQADPKNPGDIIEKDDHWGDTLRWFAMSRPTSSVKTTGVRSVYDRLPPDIRKAMERESRRQSRTGGYA